MKLTRYGRREWLSALLIVFCVICVLFCVTFLTACMSWAVFAGFSLLLLAIWVAVAAFFRDPDRTIPLDPSVVLSPADGVVKDIELIKSETLESEQLHNLFEGKDVIRIGIFLSVLNVHINRAPVPMKVLFREYKPGAFHDARDGRCIKENEAMLLGACGRLTDLSYPVAVRQVSGAIARRIVCPVEPGTEFQQGEQYGMIKFGSRTEVFLPAGVGIEVTVKVGEAVTAGLSRLAMIPDPARDKIRSMKLNEEGGNKK